MEGNVRRIPVNDELALALRQVRDALTVIANAEGLPPAAVRSIAALAAARAELALSEVNR